jgi:hypothetical protein
MHDFLDCCHPCRHLRIHDKVDGQCLQLFSFIYRTFGHSTLAKQNVIIIHFGTDALDLYFRSEMRDAITSHIVHSVQYMAIMCVIKQCSCLLSVVFVQYD